MAVVPFTDGRIYVAGINLSGHSNEGMLEINAQELDASTIKDGWDVTILGRKHVELNASGYWEAGSGKPDDLYAKLGSAGQVVTLCPDGDEGGVAYSCRAVPVKYTIGGQAGEIFPFAVNAKGDTNRAVRGTVMHDDVAARTSTANGTARNLGAVSASQRVYSALHVIAASGTTPTLDVVISSDDAQAFTTPTTRLTHSQQTTIGADWQSAVGAITDTWWRVQWTVAGTTPSFTFVVALAIT